MKVDVLLGLQWGDEGKGKIVDVLSPNYDIIARFQGGPNAGHTLIFNGAKHILHTIPSGIFRSNTQNLIGTGVIIDPFILKKEIDKIADEGIEARKNLLISKRAHLILPTHRLLDAACEAAKGKNKIGSTLKGIGPAYTDKYARLGIRIGEIFHPGFHEKYVDLKKYHLRMIEFHQFDTNSFALDGITFEEYEKSWFQAIEFLKDFTFVECEQFVNQALKEGRRILAEGAQGTMLDVDYGTYPFVTSSNTITAGVCSGLGIAPSKIGNVYGVFKAYCTRVGSGPFPTELNDETGQHLRDKGCEYGSTTGRPRRTGWLDLPALKYSILLNGVNHLFMMKADVLSELENISVCTHYKTGGQLSDMVTFEAIDERHAPHYESMNGWKHELDAEQGYEMLPATFKEYVRFIENAAKIPVSIISVGPDRTQTITLENFKKISKIR